MGPIRGRGRSGGGSEFSKPPLQKFTGPLLQIFHTSAGFSAQAHSVGDLFEQIGLRGGGSVDMSKSQRHTRSGAGRGVNQANEAEIYPRLTGCASMG